MAISVVDTLTEEEQALVDFYAANPRATWVDALEALELGDADELRIFKTSIRLKMWGYLRVIDPTPGQGHFLMFEVKGIF